MKKITVWLLLLCVLLTATGCSENTAKEAESASETSTQAAASSEGQEHSAVETTAQPEDTTESETEAATTESAPPAAGIQLLDLEKTSWYDYEWSDENAMTLVECEYSSILLGDDDAGRYPELADALQETADAQEGYLKDEYNMLTELAYEQAANGTDGFSPLVSTRDTHVRRADSTVLSILVDMYYDNGVFSSRDFLGENYDTETGEVLWFSDVVTDVAGFAQAAKEQLFHEEGADVFHNDNIIKEYFEMYGEDGTHWTIDDYGVTVYFTEGEIANPGFGILSVTVTFAEHPALFNPKYMTASKAYIVALPMDMCFSADLNEDGICEKLGLFDSYDEENPWCATIEIHTPEVSYVESFWAYDCEPYYVKTAGGRHYLYLFTELETQMYLYIYELQNQTISKVGEASLSPFYDDGISAVPTNPDRMHFDVFTEESGSVPEGDAFFSVGDDGMPVRS